MEQIVVKLEDQSNGEILLYYVDENGDNQEGVLTTIENIENPSIQLPDNSYILGSLGDIVDDNSLQQQLEEQNEIQWDNEDIRRLLIFYNDNKPSFISGTTQRKHLWTVACKTMLIGKTHESCESKLQELQSKYIEVQNFIKRGVYVKWPYFDICHEAFQDEKTTVASISEFEQEKTEPEPVTIIKQESKEKDDVVTVRQVHGKNPEVVKMLKLYLKYKQSFRKGYWRKDLWEKIAQEMGENDGEYLQKRFLNYKQHYILMLEKRKESASTPINWPYMELFDQIFKDDATFHKKYFNTPLKTNNEPEENINEWNNIQTTVLAKYYYESYEEFEDPTIPNKFLWTEVGRLIDKTPEQAKTKFESMKEEHLDKYISGNYKLEQRIPVSIIYDHIIAKDIKKELNNGESIPLLDPWRTAEIDELVQFINDNTQLFKDMICHYVCWAALCKKLKRDLVSISTQWKELSMLYSSILEDKKENPDMQIDWRYIDWFDLIFDYGMDVKFLKGFEDSVASQKKESGKVVVRKLTTDEDMDSDYSPESAKKTSEPRTDPRSTKILEFYLKNKDKSQYMKSKVSMWDPLAKEIGLNSTQCAHRFRSLRQTYLDYVQKEIHQPKVPITWPYYSLCKKIFGHRSVKNKIKNGHVDDAEWLAREIKELISFFSKYFYEITNNIDDVSKWSPLAAELGKSEVSCKDKFLELRKCYRKLKTMRSRNPGVKISWSYFDMFDRIYTAREESMALDTLDEQWPEEYVEESMEEDDYQCIIVLPEGQDLSTINDSQMILPPNPEESEEINGPIEPLQSSFYNKWTKRTKKLLLIHYINYIRSHRGKEISSKDMWKYISLKLTNKTPINCRKMFLKLKNSFKNASEDTKLNSPFKNLLEKALKLKPRFSKVPNKALQEGSFKNVELPHDKIYMALKYYLEHIEEFANPKFDQTYLWNELAIHISEPLADAYNKINYLKQAFNIETDEINGQKTEFGQLLKDIIMKEVAVKSLLDVNSEVEYNDNDTNWSDDETEKLLNWYLSNLDKFKNPKFDRSYLWLDAAAILNRSPVVCSKKMSEIRTQYRNMVKKNSPELGEWRFLELCQKIYGTGKRRNVDYMK